MQVQQCMTRDVHTIEPGAPVKEAAETMARHDLGALPVALSGRLIGMATDRDIAIRGVGRGKGPEVPTSEIMTEELLYCRSGDDVRDVLASMGESQVRRLPVLDDDKQLVGIVSIGDLAKAKPEAGGAGLALVAEPSDHHSQDLN
ncbi:MAG: CBS domain-containing protein [Erythrobacter sp.]|nr:CBS domain-containing protein [Maricaulis sp.]MBO6767384.1 CBS domain-containing protein [Erythrobacter sp.]